MPTATPPPPPAPSAPPKGKQAGGPAAVAFDDFVDARIRQTRRAVKTADLATGLATLLAGALGFLLAAALIEHWLVPGGFSEPERLGLFAVGMIGAVAYAAWRLSPLVLSRVNPLYAAHEIERDSPSLKNSLVNLLQLRDTATAGPAIRQTLERQAAERLASTGETAIDRAPLLRAAWVLLSLVTVIGVYTVASPKNFFASAGRIVMPWANIVAPTRVRIEDVEPGAVEVSQGDRLTVTAMVTGRDEGEPVELVYSTPDGRVVDRRIAMRPSEVGVQFSATLPPGSGADLALGLQNDLTYRLEAGDARTPRYSVRVLTSPTIAPLRVRYDYPTYTGYSPRDVEGVGDLRAIEGTRITLTAEANLPIDSAQIDLRADGRPDVRMRINERQASGQFTLRRSGQAAMNESTSYVLRFTSVDGQANHSPPTYRLETIADLPPEAAVLEPEAMRVDVAVDRPVTITLEARDPDFALAAVRLVGESDGRGVLRRSLLSSDLKGRFFERVEITPERLGLRPGDVLDYWVEAADNRTPDPNRVESARRQLRIVGPSQPGKNQGERGGEGQPSERGQQGDPGEKGEGVSGEKGDPSARGDSTDGNQRQQGDDPSGRSEQGEQPTGDQQRGDQANEDRQPKGEQDKQDEQQGPSRQNSPDGMRAPGDQSGQPSDDQQQQGGEGEASDDASDSDSQSPSGGGQSGGERSGDPNDSSQNQNGQPGDQGQEGQQGQPGDQGQGGDQGQPGDSSPSPVARDGSDDGAAFERIQEHLDQQQENDRGQDGSPSGDPQTKNDHNGDPSGRQPSDSDGPAEGAEETTGQPRDAQGESPDRSPSDSQPQQGDQPGEQSDSVSSDPGGSAEPGQPTDRRSQPREGTGDSGQNQAADEGGGQAGDRGAGQSSGQPGEQQESDKPTGESGDQPGEGTSSRATDRQRPGEGAEGERTDQSGDGESTDSGPTGQQGERGEPGSSQEKTNEENGSPQGDRSQQPGERGQGSPGGSPSEGGAESNRSDRDSDGFKPQGDRSDKPPRDNDTGQPGGEPQGGDASSQRPPTDEDTAPGAEPGGDDANLDYARKQTDLVLDRLEERLAEQDVDRSLLDKLGWSEQDLRRFLDRWRKRKQQAATGDKGEAQLDDALRSLGLKPTGPKARSSTRQDDLRDLRERARTAVPPRLRDSLEWYNRSLNRTPDGDASAPADG